VATDPEVRVRFSALPDFLRSSADYATPLYPHKLALTSPTSDGRSVGIVRSRTRAAEFVCLLNTSVTIV
jgi:hypothetical protein